MLLIVAEHVDWLLQTSVRVWCINTMPTLPRGVVPVGGRASHSSRVIISASEHLPDKQENNQMLMYVRTGGGAKIRSRSFLENQKKIVGPLFPYESYRALFLHGGVFFHMGGEGLFGVCPLLKKFLLAPMVLLCIIFICITTC